MTHYIYKNEHYNTIDEVNAAVTATKDVLDNQPIEYCEIKQLTGNAEDGWIIPDTLMTNDEILAITNDGYYSVYSQFSGQNYIGLTAAETLEKLEEFKIMYGNTCQVNTILTITAPTNEDMSVYVSSEV